MSHVFLFMSSYFVSELDQIVESVMYLIGIQIVLNQGYCYVCLVFCSFQDTLPDNLDLVVLLKRKACLQSTKI